MTLEPFQIPLDLGHKPDLRLENLLVAPCNQHAVSMLLRWPDWPVPVLVVYGPRRSGKTHIAKAWQEYSNGIWLEPQDITEERLAGFTNHLDQPIILDNADLVVDERLLFHLYNIARIQGQALLMTASSAPAFWGLSLKDLDSRLKAAAAIAIGAPDDELIGMMLVKHFSDRQLPVGAEVTQFLVPRVERSFEYLDQLVSEIDQAALSAKRKITVPFVREILLSLERLG